MYGGYLKSYMDQNIGDKFGLGIGAPDKKCSYNESIDPTVFNCFGILYRYVFSKNDILQFTLTYKEYFCHNL